LAENTEQERVAVATGDALVFDINDMDCADCAAHLEEAVRKLPQVAAAELNFATALLTVTPAGTDPALRRAVQRAVEKVGQQMGHAAVLRGAPEIAAAPQRPDRWQWVRAHRRDLLTAAAGVLIVVAFLARLAGVPWRPARWT